jgi:hypothetical protein
VPLTAGSTIGRYQIRMLLGSGGMGEVYRAHDPTLGRSVALKVLRPGQTADADRMTRFLQEARAASALNHPNILTVHEVGEHNASRYIVAEFVEGETLRQRIERGPLSLREILDVAIQTASALAAAHAAGIVHRDVKPENLMLRPDGYVKVLDFGVAKLAQNASNASLNETMHATIAPDTDLGMVVGTMAYMSPEQARGLAVDGRSDSFSLGVVLFELVTGRTPFVGPTASDILVAILDKEPPPLRLLARGLPLQLEWIIAKALEKDPNLRYQSIADLRVDLIRLKAAIESGRLAEAAPAGAALPPVDQPLEVELTDDSAHVHAVSTVSRATIAFGVVAAVALLAAMYAYPLARPGADLPLLVPKGAVVTKARDALKSLGYTNWGPRQDTEFGNALNVPQVARLEGLDAARQAIREGVVAHWAVGLTQTRDPSRLLIDEDSPAGGVLAVVEPDHGDFAVRLDPRGEMVSAATGLSPEPAVAPDRSGAVTIGLDTLRRVFGVDAASYDSEFLERAFPAGTVEMTWRNPTRRFGHHEQFRVHLQGERVVRVARSFERPPGFREPDAPLIAQLLQQIGPVLIGVACVVAWGFGLFVLVKTRSWDAPKQRLPLAMCAILALSTGLDSIAKSGVLQSLLGVVVVSVLLAGVVLPALSGVLLWIRRQTPGRVWAAEQLTRGRVLTGAVSVSLVAGVMTGAAMAAVLVMADFAGLRINGYVPSISREIEAVGNGMADVLSSALAAASFLAVGLALGVEALERARVPRAVLLLIVGMAAAVMAGGEHQTMLARLPGMAGLAVIGAIAATTYQRRGLLAAWVAFAAAAVLIEAMAARSLDDPDLVRMSSLMGAMVAAVAACGIWGVVAEYHKRRRTAPVAPAMM